MNLSEYTESKKIIKSEFEKLRLSEKYEKYRKWLCGIRGLLITSMLVMFLKYEQLLQQMNVPTGLFLVMGFSCVLVFFDTVLEKRTATKELYVSLEDLLDVERILTKLQTEKLVYQKLTFENNS